MVGVKCTETDARTGLEDKDDRTQCCTACRHLIV